MKSFMDTCIDFFQSEDMKKNMKGIIQPIGSMVYNEIIDVSRISHFNSIVARFESTRWILFSHFLGHLDNEKYI